MLKRVDILLLRWPGKFQTTKRMENKKKLLQYEHDACEKIAPLLSFINEAGLGVGVHNYTSKLVNV